MEQAIGAKAPDTLTNTCALMLEEAGIEPFANHPGIYWMMPPELIEEYLTGERELRMFGYPINMEILLGEATVVLNGTLGVREVPSG